MAQMTAAQIDVLWHEAMRAFSGRRDSTPPPDKAAIRAFLVRADIEQEGAEQALNTWVNTVGTPAQVTWKNANVPLLRRMLGAVEEARRENGTAVA